MDGKLKYKNSSYDSKFYVLPEVELGWRGSWHSVHGDDVVGDKSCAAVDFKPLVEAIDRGAQDFPGAAPLARMSGWHIVEFQFPFTPLD